MGEIPGKGSKVLVLHECREFVIVWVEDFRYEVRSDLLYVGVEHQLDWGDVV